VPPATGATTIVTATTSPGWRVPNAQRTCDTQEPSDGWTDTNVVPPGTGNDSVASVAGLSSMFPTRTV
jgi:hypothetical protein